MGQSDLVWMRNPALNCRIFCFVHCHSLQFGYEFLHYIAGFLECIFDFFAGLCVQSVHPDRFSYLLIPGKFHFSSSLFPVPGQFCLSVIGCFPYFFLAFSGSLCYSIYNNVCRISPFRVSLKKNASRNALFYKVF